MSWKVENHPNVFILTPVISVLWFHEERAVWCGWYCIRNWLADTSLPTVPDALPSVSKKRLITPPVFELFLIKGTSFHAVFGYFSPCLICENKYLCVRYFRLRALMIDSTIINLKPFMSLYFIGLILHPEVFKCRFVITGI